MILGDAASKLETFVGILNHISRSITLSLFTLKPSYLVKWPISTWSFMRWCQFIDLLKLETRPSSLLNFSLEKSVFREAWSPELTSQSFPVPCFWSRGFVSHRKWNLMLLVHQNTGKENRYGKNFFAVLISTLERFDRANKIKKSVIYTLRRVRMFCSVRHA